MKKNIYKRLPQMLFFCLVATLLLFSACEQEEINPPVITSIRNYAPSPDDTIVQTLNTGQWVVVHGKNLSEVTQVYFGSIPATINNTLFTDATIVVQVPSIPFHSIPSNMLNEIAVVNAGGRTIYTIDIVGEPIITHVRNYTGSPNDEIVESIFPGQEINIVGYNLKNATQIAFQGVGADLNNTTLTDSSAIVRVPEILTGGDASLANTISYTTRVGTGNFFIKIIGPPIITMVSNEAPEEGAWVYLYGNNLVSVQSLTYAGAEISSFEELEEGTTIKFMVPALSQSGPVVITTSGGEFTTTYNVNDITTGIISTFEWGDDFRWDWWGGAVLHSGDPDSDLPHGADFPGNSGQYLVLTTDVLNPGDGADWSTAVRIPEAQWVPSGNLSDPVNNWAIKFEINIPNNWNGGTLNFRGANGDIMVRYTPWQISSTNTTPFKTSDWQTMTFPLSSFRKNNGTGDPISSLTELVGSEGKSNLILYIHNYSSSPTNTGFYAAFDNFRVIKVR